MSYLQVMIRDAVADYVVNVLKSNSLRITPDERGYLTNEIIIETIRLTKTSQVRKVIKEVLSRDYDERWLKTHEGKDDGNLPIPQFHVTMRNDSLKVQKVRQVYSVPSGDDD